jgi:hypothetical protein
MRRLLTFALPSLLAACDPAAPVTDAGADSPAPADAPRPTDAGRDAPLPDAGPAADFTTAPENTWTYVPIPGGACGNGSTYGVAVNRSTASRRLFVFFQGGGACWDDATCNFIPLASHISENVSAGTVIGEARGNEGYLFSRDPDVNPFADATFVYLPYCTGDVHAGDVVQEYRSGAVHHVGHRNVAGVLAALVAGWSDADRVWVSGASAGGYGSMVAWYRFREAFPDARVDCLNDSGPPVNLPATRWNEMVGSWAVPEPTSCPECLGSLSAVNAYYERTATDGDRFALLQYTQDDTIRSYTGLDGTELQTAVLGLVDEFAATDSHRIFVLAGPSHVVLTNPGRSSGGVVVRDWVRAFAEDGPGWENVTP